MILPVVFCYVFPLDLSDWVFKIPNKRAFFISHGGYNLIYFSFKKILLVTQVSVFVCNSISRCSVQKWWHFGTRGRVFLLQHGQPVVKSSWTDHWFPSWFYLSSVSKGKWELARSLNGKYLYGLGCCDFICLWNNPFWRIASIWETAQEIQSKSENSRYCSFILFSSKIYFSHTQNNGNNIKDSYLKKKVERMNSKLYSLKLTSFKKIFTWYLTLFFTKCFSEAEAWWGKKKSWAFREKKKKKRRLLCLWRFI